MIRFLHLFLLSLFVYLNAISAQNSGSNGVATPPALPPDDEASPPASPPGVEALLPDEEVSALQNLLRYLRNKTAADLVKISFCSKSSYQDLGSIEVYCNCSTSVCNIQEISGAGSSDLSSSSSSSSGLAPPDVTGLKFLKSLTLTNMGLQSSILDCLGNLTALESLDLSDNQLSGNISTNIGKLTSLRYLDLSYNQLSGNITTNIGKLTFLRYLDLSYNRLSGQIPASIGSLSALEMLLLGHNLLEGSIPDLKRMENLIYLRLQDNRLSGSFPPELGNLKQLTTFDVGQNFLTGEIPKAMCDKLPSLMYFYANGNNLSGEIPGDIRKCTSLNDLYLTGNNFNGPLHKDIFTMSSLRRLAISDLQNGSPTFIPENVNLNSIYMLTLRNCKLSADNLDRIWKYNESLQYLDLSFNDDLKNLSDRWAQHLNAIAWGSNALWNKSFQYTSDGIHFGATPNRPKQAFYEPPPCSEGNYRTSLFINCGGGELNLNGTKYESDNDTAHLYQSRPPACCWAYSCMGLSGSGEYVRNLSCAVGFSDTSLYATARVCPVSLVYYGFCFRNGRYDVKLEFAEIEYTKDEDYSILNKRIFDIRIQQETIMKDFNIAEKAKGPAKDVPIIHTINIINHTLEIQLYWAGKGSFVGDATTFDGVLISAISVTPTAEPPGLNSVQIAFITIACVVFLGIIILALAWQQGWIGDKELYEKRIDIRGKKFTAKQLIKATHNFSSTKEIGSGGFGAVYKAELAGQVIAVKKLSPRSKQGILEFRRELYSLKSLRHPNFVELLDGYSGHGFHLLIYEYMLNKSLADVLFDPNSKHKLNWQVRYNICKDIAIGLKYLHEESHLNMIHGDIKASNILLDGELKAKISDFGLAKIYIEDDQATVVKVGGTTGYMAPEYASQGMLSHKIDVYSFGVVLLEIVSGRKNIEYKPSEESKFLLDSAYVLHKKGKSMNLVDEDLREDLTEQESHEAKSVLLVAMMCVSLSPSLRPTMSEVVSVLQGEKTIEQVSDEHATASTSRSIGNTTERLDQRNWSSTDHTPSSTNISSVATTTYFVIKEKNGKNDQLQGSSLEISLDIKKEQQEEDA